MSLVPVSLSPELVIEHVATRPRGGARRRPGPARTGRTLLLRSPEKSATHQEGLVVDAFDAAFFIGRHCIFWQAVQVLAHPETAHLAGLEARQNIESRLDDLPILWMLNPMARRDRAEVMSDLAELDRSIAVIKEAHEIGLIQAA